MQYGQLITRSLSIVWRWRYLWLLAILGGADVGTGGFGGSFSNVNSLRGPTGGRTVGRPSVQFTQFLQDNAGAIVALLVIVAILALAWFLLSCITTGALVRASAEHDADRPFRFGLAWQTGLGTFWPILGLRLLGLVFGLVAVAMVGLLVLLGFLAYAGGQSGSLAAVVAVGTLFLLVLIPVAVVVGIVFILATRAVVLEQRGPIAALGRALRLFGERLGRTLLVWLIQVGVSIGVGIAVLLVLGLLFLVLGGLVFGIALAAGPVGAIIVGIPFGLAFIAAALVVGGATGAYFSTY